MSTETTIVEFSPEMKKAAYDALCIYNGGCNPLPLLKTLLDVTRVGAKELGFCNSDVIKTDSGFAPARLIMVQMSHLFFGVTPDVDLTLDQTNRDVKFCEELAQELEQEFRKKYPSTYAVSGGSYDSFI